jgi:hypothetical protein
MAGGGYYGGGYAGGTAGYPGGYDFGRPGYNPGGLGGPASGLGVRPGLGVGDNPTREQMNEGMKHMDEKLANNPSGFLMYHPKASRSISMPKLLSIEFATELLEAILAVSLLAQTGIGSFGGRVGFVFVAGILAAIATNVSYWNWYGFPSAYIAAYMLIQIVGFLCIGLVAALVLGRQEAKG